MHRKILRKLGNPLTDRGIEPQCSINIPLIHIPFMGSMLMSIMNNIIHYEVNGCLLQQLEQTKTYLPLPFELLVL